MFTLTFQELFEKETIIFKGKKVPKEKIVLARHNYNDSDCHECYEKRDLGWWDVYQQTQNRKKQPFNGKEILCAFLGEFGTSARFIGCWSIEPMSDPSFIKVPDGFKYVEFLNADDRCFYKLTPLPLLEDYKNRLIVDWGKGTRSWYQNYDNKKKVIAIERPQKIRFTSYEEIILTFDQLRTIADEPGNYQDWVERLSCINAVYLITDRKTETRYVGSAYGKEGLWGRWSHYVSGNGHLNDNLGIKQYLEEKDASGKELHSMSDFDFTILCVTPKTIGKDEALRLERLYKEKLHTRSEHNLNQN